MSRWRAEDHFVSWLRLCPDDRVRGGRVIWQRAIADQQPAERSFPHSANSLRESNTYLRAQFRRLRRKLEASVAIEAMAAKLARLVYRMLRYGMQFVDQGADVYEAAHRRRLIHNLKQRTAHLGFQIIAATAA